MITKNLILLSLVFFGTGCSLLVNFEECQETVECTEKFGTSATCMDGICDVPDFKSANCQEFLGTPAAPNTLTVGVILALSGGEEGFGKPLKDAIEVAYNDIEKVKVNGQDVAVLFCDDQSSLEGSLAAAKHLTDIVKVPAIIGPEFSDHIKPLLEESVLKSETVLVSPSATAALISSLDDNDLIWRTAPSDVFQAEAIASLLGATKDAFSGAGEDKENIWILTAGDGIYTGGLRDGLTANFPSSVQLDSVVNLNYPVDDFGDWVNENLKNLPSPDIVVVLGFAEAWDLARTIDDFASSEPIFIFGDGAKNQEKAEQFPVLSQRILGTAPQSVGDPKYSPYSTFRTKFLSAGFQGPDQAQFLPHAYDALYIIALAAGANGTTGPQIAKGLKRLSKGKEIAPTRAGLEEAFGILRESDSATIDYSGASGRLDFDKNGDPSRAPISLWCFDGQKLEDENVLLNEDNVFSFEPEAIFGAEGCLKELASEQE